MHKKTGFLLVLMMVVFVSYGLSEAAHFDIGGSHIEDTHTVSINLSTACSDTDIGTSPIITIMPDFGEHNGNPVTVSYCWSASGETHITGAGYGAFGGIGETVAVSSNCTSTASVTPSGAATFNLIHNSISTPQISYPASTISGNQTVNVPLTCGSFNARIGDQLQGNGGVGGAVYGPTFDPNTYATFTFFMSADLSSSSKAVPTMNEWGMIIFVALAGLGAIYYLRRQKAQKVR
jgi:hypothetical protein